jgi:hypothetical protein
VVLLLFWSVCVTIILADSGGRIFDFAQEWTSARNALQGQPVYLPMEQSVKRDFGDAAEARFAYNAHPPASVLLALPFALLDYQTAYLSWNLLSVGCLLASLWMVARHAALRRSEALFLGTLLVVSNAFLHQTVQGQWNLVLMLLIVSAWVSERSGREGLSGSLLGLAAAIKIFPGFLALYYLARKEWRGLFAVVTSFLVANLLAAWAFGVGAFSDYVRDVLPELARFRDAWPNASLLGFWSRLFDGQYGRVVPVVRSGLLTQSLTLACGAAVVGITARRVARARGRTQKDLGWAFCCVTMLLVSPITWDHYFLLLVLPFVLAWKSAGRSWGARVACSLLAFGLLTLNPRWIWQLVLGGGHGPRADLDIATPLQSLTVIALQFYLLLGLYLLLLVRPRPTSEARRSRVIFAGLPRRIRPAAAYLAGSPETQG